MEPTVYDTPGELELELRIPAGELVVRAAGSDQTTLHITGERDPDEISVKFDPGTTGSAHLVVDHEQSGRHWRRSRQLAVEVVVPEDTHVRVEAASADLRTQGTLTSLAFRSKSGSASIDDLRGTLEVKTASGDLRANTVGGAITTSTASGDILVNAARADVTARSASGDVTLRDTTGVVRITTASGDVELSNAAGGMTDVRTVSGDVSIGVASGTPVHLDISSLSGDMVSELPVSDEPVAGDVQELELHVNTASGDVRIRRGTTSPAR
jgi:DUF4097 and DUF4098 domain-containing protein YvlB